MTIALARVHYDAIHSSWLAAGGIDATMRGDAHALTLLGVLGDLDDVVVCIDLGWPVPGWAR